MARAAATHYLDNGTMIKLQIEVREESFIDKCIQSGVFGEIVRDGRIIDASVVDSYLSYNDSSLMKAGGVASMRLLTSFMSEFKIRIDRQNSQEEVTGKINVDLMTSAGGHEPYDADLLSVSDVDGRAVMFARDSCVCKASIDGKRPKAFDLDDMKLLEAINSSTVVTFDVFPV